MRALGLVLLLLSFAAGFVWAKSYSCIDESGQRYIAGSLQGLPETCRSAAQEIDSEAAGGSSNSDPVVEGQAQQEAEQVRDLRLRAEKLKQRYEKASKDKALVKNRWETGAQEKIKKADTELARVREKKKFLLQELAESALNKGARDDIRSLLSGISAE